MFSINNPHNYVRPETLKFLSIEFLALIAVIAYLIHLLNRKQISKDHLFFLALPFSDSIFRLYGVQLSEIVIISWLALSCRKIKLTPVLGIALTFIAFALISYFNPAARLDLGGNEGSGVAIYGDLFSLFYSFRFLLTALFFSTIIRKPLKLDSKILKFVVIFTFAVTFLQVSLWLLGLPIDGIFYNGIIPRAKGLAHEPATWAIWILSLFPYILYFKLGRLCLIANLITLFFTFSTFGFVSLIGYFSLIFARYILASSSKFRIRKEILFVTYSLALIFVWGTVFNYSAVQEALSNTVAIFEKLIYYFEEFSSFSQGQNTLGLSGRGSDFILFSKYFNDHWLLGIGSFKSVGLEASATNFYLTTPIEIGILGVLFLSIFMFLHYLYLLKNSRSKYFWLFSLNFLIMIAGIRCFSFHELWYAQANSIRVSPDSKTSKKLEIRYGDRVTSR